MYQTAQKLRNLAENIEEERGRVLNLTLRSRAVVRFRDRKVRALNITIDKLLDMAEALERKVAP